MKNYTRLLLEIIELLEERNWEYEITIDGKFILVLGNVEYKVDKTNDKILQQILDDIQSW